LKCYEESIEKQVNDRIQELFNSGTDQISLGHQAKNYWHGERGDGTATWLDSALSLLCEFFHS
jgi:hypothetical protein